MARKSVFAGSRFLVFLLILVMVGTGCSIMTHYPSRMQSSIQMFEAGDLTTALTDVEKRFNSNNDKLAYLMEGGIILHNKGDLKRSTEIFQVAEDVMQKQEDRAVVSLSEGTAQLGSLLLNEKTLAYEGADYEKVLTHNFMAMNFLFMNDYESARVEIRKALALQEKLRDKYEEKLAKAKEKAEEKDINMGELTDLVISHYEDQQDIASRIKSSYEDPFAYYISALVYEKNGEFNDAYIDLKRVQELFPGHPAVENDLLRMSLRSSLHGVFKEQTVALGKKPRFLRKGKEGEIVVIFECGMAPRKGEVRIPIPVPQAGLVTLAFPKYTLMPCRVDHVAVFNEKDQNIGRTQMLTDIEAVAVRNLNEKMPLMVFKNCMRAAAKGAIQATAADRGGFAGAFAANVINNFK